LGILQKISPLFFQNKKIATATIHFLKFQAQAAINTLISSPKNLNCCLNLLGFYMPKKALKRDNRYQRDKKRKLCKRRAAIEPISRPLKIISKQTPLYPQPKSIKLLFCLTTKKTLGILQKISPLFFQNTNSSHRNQH
jgi:hypothetical protein